MSHKKFGATMLCKTLCGVQMRLKELATVQQKDLNSTNHNLLGQPHSRVKQSLLLATESMWAGIILQIASPGIIITCTNAFPQHFHNSCACMGLLQCNSVHNYLHTQVHFLTVFWILARNFITVSEMRRRMYVLDHVFCRPLPSTNSFTQHFHMCMGLA